MAFNNDLARQQLAAHVSFIESNTDDFVRVIPENNKLRDLVSIVEPSRVYECKTDYYYLGNVTIEVASNFYNPPAFWTAKRIQRPNDPTYNDALDWCFSQLDNPKKRALGTDDNLEDKHLLSYHVVKGRFGYLADIREMQSYIAANEGAFPLMLVGGKSQDSWYSASYLIPYAEFETVATKHAL